MSDGRFTRLAVLLVLLLAPVAGAAIPSTNRSAADSTDGQDITDLGADPTGQFVAAVVAFDAAKTTSTGPLPPLGGLGGGTTTNNHRDLYVCDYGPSSAPTTGTGCNGRKHATTVADANTPSYPQHVATGLREQGGRQGVYAVTGPNARISMWDHNSDTARWSANVQNGNALNVTMAPDGSRVVVGAAPPTGGGTVEVRFGNNGTLIWSMPLKNVAGEDVRPTSLAHSRAGEILAIGTSKGLLLANPSGDRPNGQLGGISGEQTLAVNEVALSGDGKVVAIATDNGVFYADVVAGAKPALPNDYRPFNRNYDGTPAQAVALSVDGERFAAAVGSKIYFYQRAPQTVASPVGQPFDAGTRVSDIAYDEKGLLLVAVAGNNVYGFGPNKNTPLWTFDATRTELGGLDGPLRKAFVSDDAQRVIVAGKTKTMAYSNNLGVTSSIAATNGGTTINPTQVSSLTLTVKNTGSLSDNYSFVITTPVGWPSASADTIRLDPEQVGTVAFNVTAPPGASPGVYGVQVRVRSALADELAQRRNVPSTYIAGPAFNYTIQRSVVLNVSAPDDKVLLRQGGEQTVAVTLRNEGNAEGVVNLSTRQELTRGASWDIKFEGGDQVRVAASSSKTINMIITAPSDAGSGDRNIITVRAREGETVEAIDSVIAYVDAQFGAEMRTNKTTWEFFPGQVQTIRLNVTNIGNTEDTYNLTETVTPASVASDWRVTIETNKVTIARGQTKVVVVTVKAVASDAREATLTLRTISQSSPDKQENSLALSLLTVPRPPTEEKDDKLLPAPAFGLAIAVLGAAALITRGGRR